MSTSKHNEELRKLASALQLARLRLAQRKTQLASAQHLSSLAKRRRKEAKEAARRAKKQARMAKREVADAELMLAEAEARLSSARKSLPMGGARRERPAKTAAVSPAARLVKRKARARQPAKRTPRAPVHATGSQTSDLERNPISVPRELDAPGSGAPAIASSPEPGSVSIEPQNPTPEGQTNL